MRGDVGDGDTGIANEALVLLVGECVAWRSARSYSLAVTTTTEFASIAGQLKFRVTRPCFEPQYLRTVYGM